MLVSLTIACSNMQCDRLMNDIEQQEFDEIESVMKSRKSSQTPFLSSKDSLKRTVKRDRVRLAQIGLNVSDITRTLDALFAAFKKGSLEHRRDLPKDESGDRVFKDGFQYYQDSNIKLRYMVTNMGRRDQPMTSGIVQVPLPKWKGDDPFKSLPAFDGEWSSKTRMEIALFCEGKTYRIAEVEWNGSQVCPFQHPDDKRYHGYEYGCRDYVFTNPNGDKMALSDLSYHMIKNHGFFGGDSPYRVDPLKLVNFFEIN